MLKTISLKVKLVALCAVLTATTSTVGAVSFFISGAIASNYQYVADVTIKKQAALMRMNTAFKEVRIALRTIGIEGISAADRNKAVEDTKKWIAAYEEADVHYRDLPFASGEKSVYEPVGKAWADFKIIGARILTLTATHTLEAKEALKGTFLKDCPEAAAQFRSASEALMAFQDSEAEGRVMLASRTSQRGNSVILLLSILAPVCGLVFGVLFSNRLARILKRLADGLTQSAGEVNGAAGQISSAGEDLSVTTDKQAHALLDTVASLEEVSAMVSKNADNARRSKEAAVEGHEAALRGKRAMDEMLAAIADIRASNGAIKSQVESSNGEIGNIVKIIAEIGTKTKVIHDIVFQTKLLSFNASVEAARAGEHGSGFAVVAQEIGNLAQMSGSAAREISLLLEESIRKVESTIKMTKERVESLIHTGQNKVTAGSTIATRCGAALDEIVRSVEGLTQMVTEIATASQEQAQGVQDIKKSIEHIDQVAQQNVMTSRQTADAGVELSGQATILREVVANLVHTVDGARAPQDATPIPQAERSTRVVSLPKRAA